MITWVCIYLEPCIEPLYLQYQGMGVKIEALVNLIRRRVVQANRGLPFFRINASSPKGSSFNFKLMDMLFMPKVTHKTIDKW